MTLTDVEIQDLVTGTLKDLGRLKFNQIAQTLQRHEVMGRIMRKQKVQFDGGTGIKRTLMVTHSGAAKHVGLYEPDAVNVGDVLATVNIPWRRTTTNYAFEVRELLENYGASKIVDLLKVRRTDAMLSLIILMESSFWEKPASSADKVTPFGVPYWVCKANTTDAGGFEGGDPTGFADGAGGISSSDHAAWQNWTADYVNVTKEDLIIKMRRAFRNIHFESPVDVPDYRRGNGDQYRIYMNQDTIEDFETLAEKQNENLGRDLAPMDDSTAFRRNPVRWVPQLDSDSTDPVYFLNYAFFHPVFLRGDYLRETGPDKAANQHNVRVVHIDLSWNTLCTDRRRQAVVYKKAD